MYVLLICIFLLFCFRVGKEIIASDPVPQDVDLDSDLYVLWGVRVNDSQPGMLLTHDADAPARSLEQVNPAGQGLGLIPPVSYPVNIIILGGGESCIGSSG